MWCGVITLFPEMFKAITEFGITHRAIKKGLVDLEFWNPRDFTTDNHKTVDDRPYGGGPGMVMLANPLAACIQAAKKKSAHAKTIYLSPQGKPLNHKTIATLAVEPQLILLAGRYEGVDERLLDTHIDESYSIGDYVLSGGELPIMVILDAIIRLLPGALGDENSNIEESFVDGLLDCPHFTRPEVWNELKVPEVLLSGDHKAIDKWRYKQKLGRTFVRRPDLLQNVTLSQEDKSLIHEYLDEY